MGKILSIILAGILAVPATAQDWELREEIVVLSKEDSQKLQRSEDILRWAKVKVGRGYILSNDLYYSQGCKPTWDKHVRAFRKRNPHVKNPNKIEYGTLIEVQTCVDKTMEAFVDPKPPVIVSSPAPEIEMPIIGESNPLESDVVWIDIYGGLITEAKYRDTSFVGGVGVHGDMFSFLGYDVRILASDIVALTKGEIHLKTSPDKVRYLIAYGLANRIGLGNSDLDRLESGVDSYSYLGLGLELTPSDKHRVMLIVSHNISEKTYLNGSVSAQKRISKDNWLGVFVEYHSTKSSVDRRSDDRRYLTGGLKFSF